MDTASSTPDSRETNPLESEHVDAPVTTAHTTPATKEKGSVGGLLGIIIFIGIVIVGAFYAWGARIAHEPPPQKDTAITE